MVIHNERITYPDQIWFDASEPGPLHDALRLDYARTKAAIERRPSLRRHVAGCSVCQMLTGTVAEAPNPIASRRRLKLKINLEQMHALLGLPGNYEIVHMFAEPDPNTVTVLVAGEGLPEVDPLTETPSTPVDVFERTRDRAS